jgi:hypothetical protein
MLLMSVVVLVREQIADLFEKPAILAFRCGPLPFGLLEEWITLQKFGRRAG